MRDPFANAAVQLLGYPLMLTLVGMYTRRVVVPRLRRRIRGTAAALYASESISLDQYHEACMRCGKLHGV